MTGFEYIFGYLSKCREAFDLGFLAVAMDAQHGVATSDLMRMHDRVLSASVCSIKTVRSAVMLKNYGTIYFGNLFTLTSNFFLAPYNLYCISLT